MEEGITIDEVLANRGSWQIIDVRSPSEFERGHIPDAVNIPLFSDEERAIVGTLYKQTSQESALQKGLEIAGVKMAALVNAIQGQHRADRNKKLLIHCWRGGKRSKAVHWLISFTGTSAYLLDGGYKQYRRAMQDYFANSSTTFNILGGCTGAGKTEVLAALKEMGEQVVDLEHLANHKGSAFGGIGEEVQPSTEQFENNLYHEFLKLNPDQPIWLENESKSIGKVYLPDTLWKKMRNSVLYTIDVDAEVRLERALRYYSDEVDTKVLRASFDKIRKRLGGLEYQKALEALERNDLKVAAAVALAYYDKSYTYQISNWPSEMTCQIAPNNDVNQLARLLREASSRKLIKS